MSIMDIALRAADAECEALKAELWKKEVRIRDLEAQLERWDGDCEIVQKAARIAELEAARDAAKAALREAIEWNWGEDVMNIPVEVLRMVNKVLDPTQLEPPVSTLCAVCDQIKELHPSTHEWTPKETDCEHEWETLGVPEGAIRCKKCDKHDSSL